MACLAPDNIVVCSKVVIADRALSSQIALATRLLANNRHHVAALCALPLLFYRLTGADLSISCAGAALPRNHRLSLSTLVVLHINTV